MTRDLIVQNYMILRQVLLVFVLTYGMGCVIFAVSTSLELHAEWAQGKTFYNEFDLQDKSNSYNLVVIIYFALTTLSTVGYGDYYPIN